MKRSVWWDYIWVYILVLLIKLLIFRKVFFLVEKGDVVRVKWEKYINCVYIEGIYLMIDIIND